MNQFEKSLEELKAERQLVAKQLRESNPTWGVACRYMEVNSAIRDILDAIAEAKRKRHGT